MDELIRNMTGKTTLEMKVSPDQFIDQIACEITGCNLQIPGIKIE